MSNIPIGRKSALTKSVDCFGRDLAINELLLKSVRNKEAKPRHNSSQRRNYSLSFAKKEGTDHMGRTQVRLG